jgi:hypothetical protein
MKTQLVPVLRGLAILFSVSMIVGYSVFSQRRKNTELNEAQVFAKPESPNMVSAGKDSAQIPAGHLNEQSDLLETWNLPDVTTSPSVGGTNLNPLSSQSDATGLADSTDHLTVKPGILSYATTNIEKLGEFNSNYVMKARPPRTMLSSSKSAPIFEESDLQKLQREHHESVLSLSQPLMLDPDKKEFLANSHPDKKSSSLSNDLHQTLTRESEIPLRPVKQPPSEKP